MPRDYWSCSTCGGNFDHGEKCDCLPKAPRFKVSESLILGIDISEGDTSCIQTFRRNGDTYDLVNTISGKEAESTYDILMNRGGVIFDKLSEGSKRG